MTLDYAKELFKEYKNHKTKHNTAGRTSAKIFVFAGTPAYNTQQTKIDKFNKLNENRKRLRDRHQLQKMHC